MFLWILRIILWLPISIIHPTSIKYKKNLPKGKAILCINHRSNWDIVLYLANTTEKVGIMAKKELFHNRFFGCVIKHLGAVPIDREGNDIGAIKACMKLLKNDKKLVIFPEGTRVSSEDELGEFKSGLALIAIKTKTPIVPIWVKNKPRLFRKSTYYIGEPYELTDFYGKKLDEQTLEEANKVVKGKVEELEEKFGKKSK